MTFLKKGYQPTRKVETPSLPRPPKIQPQRNRIVTISKKLEMSWIFDDEVNEYLEQGWKLNRIETVYKDNEIYLIGFLQKY
ncbi:hypothetical protein [Clostridium sp. D53t1_180928_C8]|uniref:hypothetical protein n=1 Tax=Clostridium sp. D53t1_180928_C8 TaxID=2787101 RepID=UPI0018AC2013|nr:hypothetical protein [Clostridium sp. D53t1_180928_C8]